MKSPLHVVERQLRRTGSVYDPESKVSVKIVVHPACAKQPPDFSAEAWAVETTVAGDRRLPVEQPVPYEDALKLALAQLLNPRDHYEYTPVSAKADLPLSVSSSGALPYVSLGDLMRRYRQQGLDDQAAWKEYVTVTILQPQLRSGVVDFKEFRRHYQKS